MITAVILAKNEEQNIVDCLETLSFCSERIVIDDNSTDRTRELARFNNATVVEHKLDGDFSAQRNFALSLIRTEWAFFVDADERIPPALANEIRHVVLKDNIDGYYIRRVDKMFGRIIKHGEVKNIKLLRLGKKDGGKWEGRVHERWAIHGKTQILKHRLFHEPHKSISEFLSEINFYTTLRAKELNEKGVKSPLLSIILYTKGKFLKNYILKLGFLDGIPGIILSLMMSFHSFLVRGKLYLLNRE